MKSSLLIFFLFVVSFGFSQDRAMFYDVKCTSGNCEDGEGSFKAKSQFINKVVKQNNFIVKGQFVGGKLIKGEIITLTPDKDDTISYYNGELKDWLYNGEGVFSDNNNELKQGRWDAGKFVSATKWVLPSGSVYKGEIVDEKRHGKGVMQFTNGGIYEGNFNKNKRQGKGKMVYGNLDVYEGDWSGDNREGNGVMKWLNGDSYSGQWIKNNREGVGVFIAEEGKEYYEGDWLTDKRQGKAKYKLNGSDTLNGYFYEDVFLSNSETDYLAKLEEAKQQKIKEEQYIKELKEKKRKAALEAKGPSKNCVTFYLSKSSGTMLTGIKTYLAAIFMNVDDYTYSANDETVLKYAREELKIQNTNNYFVVREFINRNCDCKKVKEKIVNEVKFDDWQISYSKEIR